MGAQFCEVLGTIPRRILKAGKRTWEFLDKRKFPKLCLKTTGVQLKRLSKRSVQARLKRRGTRDSARIMPLLEQMLALEPSERISAHALLKNPDLRRLGCRGSE